MSDFQKMIGKDESAEFLRVMRGKIGDAVADWNEIEPILYDTFKEFEALPPVDLSVSVPELSTEKQQRLCQQFAEFSANYGRQCARSMLVPLAVARVQLWALQKYGKTP